MFYVEKDNRIIIYNEDKTLVENTLAMMPQYSDLEIQETERPIDNFQWADTEDYLTAKAQEEQDRINHLTMTPLDFIKVLQSAGLTLEQINQYLDNNLEVKMQLTYCSDVYCGVVKQFLPVSVGDIIITSDMVEQAFKTKAGID